MQVYLFQNPIPMGFQSLTFTRPPPMLLIFRFCDGEQEVDWAPAASGSRSSVDACVDARAADHGHRKAFLLFMALRARFRAALLESERPVPPSNIGADETPAPPVRCMRKSRILDDFIDTGPASGSTLPK